MSQMTTPDCDGMPLDVALADLLAEAGALEAQEPPPGVHSAFEKILAEKYRQQGIQA